MTQALLAALLGCTAATPTPVAEAPSAEAATPVAKEAASSTAATPTAEACALPNPARGDQLAELAEWVDAVPSGDFEAEGVSTSSFSRAGSAHASGLVASKRTGEAARQGDYGLELRGQGFFAIRALLDKGEPLKVSAWVRSLDGTVPVALGLGAEPGHGKGVGVQADPVPVGSEWTWLTLDVDAGELRSASWFWVGVTVPGGATLHLDDVEVLAPMMAEVPGGDRTVGGVPVPASPAAPVLMSFLMHLENERPLKADRAHFRRKSAIVEAVAEVFHRHGGTLYVQPEHAWVEGALAFDPELLGRLHREHGVEYSVHTHGPTCLDASGHPLSATDCGKRRQGGKLTDDHVITYMVEIKDLLERAAGGAVTVTDANGNFDRLRDPGRLGAAGFTTWTAYKDRTTQSDLRTLYTNPWRPSGPRTQTDVTPFVTHDPATDVLFVAGHGSALSRHPERFEEHLRRDLAQRVRFAEAERLTTFYGVTHIGHFVSKSGQSDDAYLPYDPRTDTVTPSAEFLAHVAMLDDALTRIVDPLVDEGYVAWTTLPEIVSAFEAWEQACAAL